MRPTSSGRFSHAQLATLSLVGAIALTALASPGTAQADAVTQWNINASRAIFAGAPNANVSALSFGMVQGAVYDAVNGIDGGYQPYLVRPHANPWDSPRTLRSQPPHIGFSQL
jgi:hypothetical protein